MSPTPAEPEDQDGAVSEVANLGDAEPISPDQSVAAAPGEEGDDTDDGVQEGRQGPNAVTGDQSGDERESDGP